MTNMMKQGLGAPHAPTRKLSQEAESFQELKICGHGTVLVLYVFLKGLKEPR